MRIVGDFSKDVAAQVHDIDYNVKWSHGKTKPG